MEAPQLLTTVSHVPGAAAALASLPEPARRWFAESFGVPTEAQRLAWPVIDRGEHLLLCAPTGSGKTLAAFLPLLAAVADAPPTAVVLALTPLKALANDACRNLRAYAAGLRAAWPTPVRPLRIEVRTGDTSAARRRRQLTEPPDVLLTTPESLAVLLSQPAAGPLLARTRWVVVDETHAFAADKRGSDLSLALERLQDLVGHEVQRIGLSATCEPRDEIARFLVGAGRPCTVAAAGESSDLQLHVEPLPPGVGFLAALLERLSRELTVNRRTLVFTNTRGLAERVSWALRQRVPAWADEVAVHHSSLPARRRREVEAGLKEGCLRAVVCSTSLELGLDVGDVDGVVLVHPPGDVVRLLQRVGRSGHGPGRPRRGLVLTAGPAELLEAAVTAASGRSRELEPVRIPDAPFDVLCQHLIGLAVSRPWRPLDALALVRRASPYAALSDDDFAACLDYLTGRTRDGRAWLPPRLVLDGDRYRPADARTARVLRRNVGTILGEVVVRAVRLRDGTRVGEVEEAFANRLQPGDRFLLDGRCLEFRRADGLGLLVDEVIGRPAVPRWGAGGWPLSPALARRLTLLRLQAAEAMRTGRASLVALLRHDFALGDEAVALLASLIERQESLSEVPDPTTCLIEVVARGGLEYYVHTPLNRAGNDALTRVAVLRLARDRGRAAESLVADLGLRLSVPGPELTPDDWRALFAADDFEQTLTTALSDSPVLRERFQRAALTGLMLLKNPIGRKLKVGGADWATRRLFDRVRDLDPTFVLMRQAMHDVRRDVCDAGAALDFARRLPALSVRSRRLPRISPFAEGWTQLVEGPDEAVETAEEALARLHAALMGP